MAWAAHKHSLLPRNIRVQGNQSLLNGPEDNINTKTGIVPEYRIVYSRNIYSYIYYITNL